MDDSFSLGIGIIAKATDRAVLVKELEIEDGFPVWIPQSQIHDDSEAWKEGDTGEIVVTRWFAEQRGWA